MDELFHVPQAQKYCEGKFNEVCCLMTDFVRQFVCVSIFIVSNVSTVGSDDYHSPWSLFGISGSDQACGVAV